MSGLEDLPDSREYVVRLSQAFGRVELARFRDGSTQQRELSFSELESLPGDELEIYIESSSGEPLISHRLLAGRMWNTDAVLSFSSGTGINTDNARIQYILETPSTSSEDDYDLGMYWCVPGDFIGIPDPVSGPPPPEVVPVLPAGWVYEGWIIQQGEAPISTGRFPEVLVADSDGNGPFAGPEPGMPFPGQEFIDPPLSLPGKGLWLSIEPEPDYSAAPSGFILLADELIEDPGPLVQQAIAISNNERGSLPSANAALRLASN
ncbi:hypothetical protein KDL30_02255 [bacterium]|nr:hypothetical protein [bacterium]